MSEIIDKTVYILSKEIPHFGYQPVSDEILWNL